MKLASLIFLLLLSINGFADDDYFPITIEEIFSTDNRFKFVAINVRGRQMGDKIFTCDLFSWLSSKPRNSRKLIAWEHL